MALSCQAQVFEIYDALQNASPETMGNVVKNRSICARPLTYALDSLDM